MLFHGRVHRIEDGQDGCDAGRFKDFLDHAAQTANAQRAARVLEALPHRENGPKSGAGNINKRPQINYEEFLTVLKETLARFVELRTSGCVQSVFHPDDRIMFWIKKGQGRDSNPGRRIHSPLG